MSCGHCGRALCPDCMHHGPVGVRCYECLHPLNHGGQLLSANVGAAKGAGVVLAVVWLAVLAGVALWQRGVVDDGMLAPNLLLATLAGGTVGALQWRLCGGAWDARLRTWAILLGLAMPLLAAVGVAALAGVLHYTQPAVQPIFLARTVGAMCLSGLAALVMATQSRV